MTKALIKKQIMEVFTWVYQDKKTGKNRSRAGIIGYALLYLFLFAFLGGMFYVAALSMCEPLCAVGMGWLYFALMGMLAVFMGVFGSVFNTYASLYCAKDNDMLLSMPVPPGRILLIRLMGVYIMGLMYELIVMIPTLIAWFMFGNVSALGVIFSLLITVILSVLVLVLSAALGWVVALISTRLKHKNIMVVIFSLLFFAAYYYCYANAYLLLQNILADPEGLGGKVKAILYPMYQMGLAAEGNIIAMVIFTLIVAILFGVVYFVLERSFLRIATANNGTVRTRYKERRTSMHSMSQALLQKELRRFVGSSNYMLNCGLGIVMMPLGAVFLLWKQSMIREMVRVIFPGANGFLALLTVGAVCLLISMNDMTAPSVSLEGKNLWLVQSYPIPGRQVLMAKIHMHLLLTLVPAAVLVAAAEWVLRPGLLYGLLIPVACAVFAAFMAAFGLFINLKMPNLNWTSEIVPIKQSMGVMITLFGSWAFICVLAGIYYLTSRLFDPAVFLAGASVLVAIATVSLIHWIKIEGEKILQVL